MASGKTFTMSSFAYETPLTHISWKRKSIKKSARKLIFSNYIHVILICFIVAFMIGELHQNSVIIRPTTNQIEGSTITHTKIVNETLDGIFDHSTVWSPHIPTDKTGVIATLFNNVTASGSFIFGILNAINQWFFHDSIMASLILFIGFCLYLLFYIFIGSSLIVGRCRCFLEMQVSPNVEFQQLLFIFKKKRNWNISKTLLLTNFYLLLWSFTIVGGFIKIYSYKMIPYLLAENPDLSSQEAFQISRNMMRGQKWKSFCLDCSFLLWDFLSLLTFGITGVLYVTPYREACYANLYSNLRSNPALSAYDMLPYLDITPETIIDTTRVSALSIEKSSSFSIANVILFFFTFNFIGWLWEVSLFLMNEGILVNRGTMIGPWLPIYGTAGVIMLLLLQKIKHNPLYTFFGAFFISGIIEYGTAWFLESVYHKKWWDYSNILFNIKGRVCLEGLLFFAMGGCLIIYFVAPALNHLYNRAPIKFKKALCILLVVLFATDFIYSSFHPNSSIGNTVTQANATAFHFLLPNKNHV